MSPRLGVYSVHTFFALALSCVLPLGYFRRLPSQETMVDPTHQAVSMVIAPPPVYNGQGRPGSVRLALQFAVLLQHRHLKESLF